MQTKTAASRTSLIEAGIGCPRSGMMDEDDIWSRYSNDKTDIGEHLARVIRTLSAALSLKRKPRALSIGSSSEPQFRILETAFRDAVYLLDIDSHALETVKKRIERQNIRQVRLINADFNTHFVHEVNTKQFLTRCLDSRPLDLITLHHSLYYSTMESWIPLFINIHHHLPGKPGAIHTVLMAPVSRDRLTTSWLYDHFAGKYFGTCNNQSLPFLKRSLEIMPEFRKSQLIIRKSRVYFFVDDFIRMMKVVWMILLYPDVHHHSEKQKEEITTFIYDNFYAKHQPICQEQHHLALYRGLDFRGLA
jgi:hypothetical protein